MVLSDFDIRYAIIWHTFAGVPQNVVEQYNLAANAANFAQLNQQRQQYQLQMQHVQQAFPQQQFNNAADNSIMGMTMNQVSSGFAQQQQPGIQYTNMPQQSNPNVSLQSNASMPQQSNASISQQSNPNMPQQQNFQQSSYSASWPLPDGRYLIAVLQLSSGHHMVYTLLGVLCQSKS